MHISQRLLATHKFVRKIENELLKGGLLIQSVEPWLNILCDNYIWYDLLSDLTHEKYYN